MICLLGKQVKAKAMPKLHPDEIKITVNQHASQPDRKRIDACEQLIVVLPESVGRGHWPMFPYADTLKQRYDRLPDKTCNQSLLVTDLPNRPGTRVTLACLKTDASAFERLTLGRQLSTEALKHNPSAVALFLPGLEPEPAQAMAEALVAALLAGAAPLPRFKSAPAPTSRLKSLQLLGLGRTLDLSRTLAEAAGNNLARWLTALPPNELTPAGYRAQVAQLARRYGWRMRFLDLKALRRLDAGAFLAVAQGSPQADAGIVHLHYDPPGARRGKPALALVGKGICFDTGGVNLKTAKSMQGMHEDMEGSAVALGTLLALTRLEAGFTVDAWLALAQNHIGPKAYKPHDLVRACNGTTIEVVHTDAEGRMVLADTLALATRERPKLVIDYATLTGACVYALSTRYSGAFTNRSQWVPELIEAGIASGERVWPFPCDADFDEALKSDVADVKQCTLDGEADHILAARFLNRFVPPEVPWLHIDLASGHHKGGLAHIPTDTTGFGIRFVLNLLLERKLLNLS